MHQSLRAIDIRGRPVKNQSKIPYIWFDTLTDDMERMPSTSTFTTSVLEVEEDMSPMFEGYLRAQHGDRR